MEGNRKDTRWDSKVENWMFKQVTAFNFQYHSNADCERVFSLVNKCHTDQRTLGPGTLEALVLQMS